jgi:hypothetical protein
LMVYVNTVQAGSESRHSHRTESLFSPPDAKII